MGSPSLPAKPTAPPPPPDLTDQALRAQALAQRAKALGGGAVRQSFLTGPRIAATPSVLSTSTSAPGSKAQLGG